MKLQGRFALITGAGRGLGAEIARRFIADGAQVLLCARSGADLAAVQEDLACAPRGAVTVQTADVADEAQVQQLFATMGRVFPHLDILVNNAGIHGPYGQIEDIDLAEWRYALNVNLLGTVHTCRAAIPGFKARRYGKIINISGGGATSPMPNISAYAASKAALVRLTETLAGELESWRIDVNAVSPGLMVTRMQQQLLDADPGSVGSDYHARMRREVESGGVPLSKPAGLCAYLASADSDGLSGRLLSAVWDPWPFSPEAREDLASDPEMYTLRRIVPEHRGRKRLGN